MKRILSVLALLLLALNANAYALQRTATFGDKDTAGAYRLRADTDCTGVSGANCPGWLTFAQDTGIKYPYNTVLTANAVRQLITGDSGAFITDFGGVTPSATAAASIFGQGNTYILPPATLGLVYDITTGVKETITIKTFSSSDGFMYTVSGTQSNGQTGVTNSGSKQAGDEISFACTAANTWSVVNKSGTWQ